MTLGISLGPSWTQKKISRLENKEVLDSKMLKQLSEVLQIPEKVITDFDQKKFLSYLCRLEEEEKMQSNKTCDGQSCRDLIHHIKKEQQLLIKQLKSIDKRIKPSKKKKKS